MVCIWQRTEALNRLYDVEVKGQDLIYVMGGTSILWPIIQKAWPHSFTIYAVDIDVSNS